MPPILRTTLAFLVLLTAFAQAADKPKPEAVRYHGVNWLQLGPGVISNCAAVRLRLATDTMDSVLITDPEKVTAVKQWAFRNIYSRFDLSPEEPIEGNGKPVPFVSLYSLRIYLTRPSFDYSTTPARYISPVTQIDEVLLVYIPLLPEVLGITNQQCAETIEAFKQLLPPPDTASN